MNPAGDLRSGAGEPVTLVLHGLGTTPQDVRPLGSGLRGTRVFPELREAGFAALGEAVRAAAGRYGARRAVGVSMGAGALLAALAAAPSAFDRCVLFLPVAPAGVGGEQAARLERTAALLRAGDQERLRELLAAELPAGLRDRPDVRGWLEQRARRMVADPAVLAGVLALPGAPPVAAVAQLSRVRARCLVVGQPADPAHPLSAARATARALPRAELVTLPGPGGLWRHRRLVRALIAGFLDGPDRPADRPDGLSDPAAGG